jgi:hypothetical protein
MTARLAVVTLSAVASTVTLSAVAATVACGGGDGGEATTVTGTPIPTVTAARTATDPGETEQTSGERPRAISPAEAETAARESASEYLTMSGTGLGVEPDDWQASCSPRQGGRVWICRVLQGPCSGKVEVSRVTIGGQIRGVGEVGCVGD